MLNTMSTDKAIGIDKRLPFSPPWRAEVFVLGPIDTGIFAPAEYTSGTDVITH